MAFNGVVEFYFILFYFIFSNEEFFIFFSKLFNLFNKTIWKVREQEKPKTFSQNKKKKKNSIT